MEEGAGGGEEAVMVCVLEKVDVWLGEVYLMVLFYIRWRGVIVEGCVLWCFLLSV